MRAVNLSGLLILGVASFILMPHVTTGQPGGKGFGKGGGMPSPFSSDPNQLFEYLAKGRTFFLISETRTLNAPLTQFAQEKGITNGQVSRQQFLDFNDWRAKQAAAPGGAGFPDRSKGGLFGGKKGSEGLPVLPGGAAPAGTPPSPDVINQLAEAEFKMRDRNGDGRLNRDEMNDRLRNAMPAIDKSGDGLLDFNEFKEYFTARMLGNDDSATKNIATIIIEEEDLDKKPVVFRVGGKMPSGLPGWFKELDTDNDGQVAMYEWRKGAKPMDEFANWDLNNDGFITPDEALKQQTTIAKSSPKGGSSGSVASSSEEGGGRPSRWPGMSRGSSEEGSTPSSGFGKGGFGGFGKGSGGSGKSSKKPGS